MYTYIMIYYVVFKLQRLLLLWKNTCITYYITHFMFINILFRFTDDKR